MSRHRPRGRVLLPPTPKTDAQKNLSHLQRDHSGSLEWYSTDGDPEILAMLVELLNRQPYGSMIQAEFIDASRSIQPIKLTGYYRKLDVCPYCSVIVDDYYVNVKGWHQCAISGRAQVHRRELLHDELLMSHIRHVKFLRTPGELEKMP